jgi:N-acetylmuramoyl-L-alanine amidase
MNKIAIVVGHDSIEQGAFSNLLKKSEFAYYSEVVKLLPFDIYYRSTKGGYKSKMEELAKQINGKGYTLVIELHFNSFNGVANGSEALYFSGSNIGKRFAEILAEGVAKEYGSTRRGAKAISQTNDRGYWFLKLMDAPAVIYEPFFADNVEAIKFKDINRHAKLLIDILC